MVTGNNVTPIIPHKHCMLKSPSCFTDKGANAHSEAIKCEISTPEENTDKILLICSPWAAEAVKHIIIKQYITQ